MQTDRQTNRDIQTDGQTERLPEVYGTLVDSLTVEQRSGRGSLTELLMVTESMRNCRKQSSDDGKSAVWLLVATFAASVALVDSISTGERNHSWADFLATDIPEMKND